MIDEWNPRQGRQPGTGTVPGSMVTAWVAMPAVAMAAVAVLLLLVCLGFTPKSKNFSRFSVT